MCNANVQNVRSLSITSANKETLELRTSGNVYHDIRRTYADDIRDNDREEMRCHIKEHFHTPLAKIYGEKVRNINPDIYASGNRKTARRSPNVIQRMKSEVKCLLRKTTVLIEKISDVAKTIVTKDMFQAELHQSRKFYGYVQSFSVNPYLTIVLTTESLIRLYHEYVAKNMLYLDAIGQLTLDLPYFKRTLH